jgi:hypothetical protein
MVQSSHPGLLANVHKANLGVQTGVQLARSLVANFGLKRCRINGSLES